LVTVTTHEMDCLVFDVVAYTPFGCLVPQKKEARVVEDQVKLASLTVGQRCYANLRPVQKCSYNLSITGEKIST
jgi:hypothetical protein